MSIASLSADEVLAQNTCFSPVWNFHLLTGMSFLLYCKDRTLGCLASDANPIENDFRAHIVSLRLLLQQHLFLNQSNYPHTRRKTSYWVKKGAAVTADERIRVSGQSPVTQNAQSHID
jgi:hypothetical protein